MGQHRTISTPLALPIVALAVACGGASGPDLRKTDSNYQSFERDAYEPTLRALREGRLIDAVLKWHDARERAVDSIQRKQWAQKEIVADTKKAWRQVADALDDAIEKASASGDPYTTIEAVESLPFRRMTGDALPQAMHYRLPADVAKWHRAAQERLREGRDLAREAAAAERGDLSALASCLYTAAGDGAGAERQRAEFDYDYVKRPVSIVVEGDEIGFTGPLVMTLERAYNIEPDAPIQVTLRVDDVRFEEGTAEIGWSFDVGEGTYETVYSEAARNAGAVFEEYLAAHEEYRQKAVGSCRYSDDREAEARCTREQSALSKRRIQAENRLRGAISPARIRETREHKSTVTGTREAYKHVAHARVTMTVSGGGGADAPKSFGVSGGAMSYDASPTRREAIDSLALNTFKIVGPTLRRKIGSGEKGLSVRLVETDGPDRADAAVGLMLMSCSGAEAPTKGFLDVVRSFCGFPDEGTLTDVALLSALDCPIPPPVKREPVGADVSF
ncbi:MAG: hypothetical protein IT385_01335 [Deltaproteobacteria bacterium]|nr:hypothetical protein [Deltaproteobacteria bacterium]